MENSPGDDEVLAGFTPCLFLFKKDFHFISNVFVYLGEVVAEGERSKAGKKRPNAPWAKLLSQYPQVSQVAS